MVNRRGGRRNLSVADFLEALESRLAAMKAEQLRTALMAHAEGLPSSEREPFLAIFDPQTHGARAGGGTRPGQRAKPDTLLEDIEALVGAGEHGWSPGSGEDERGDEWEEESWMEDELSHPSWPAAEFAALFTRADGVFRAGDLALARDAYRRLLYAVAAFQEEAFDEYDTSEPVAQADLSEVKARYFRALYETTGPEERPALLLRAMQDLQFVGSAEVGLPEVIGTRRVPLPDREAFLDGWIEFLGRAEAELHGFGPEIQRLLFQAVAMQRGIEGLAELARRDGRRIPEAYRKWILALAAEDRMAEAVPAAQEALRDLPPTGDIRAWIAEFLAEAAGKRGDGSALLDARREAFRAAPGVARLSALCEAASPLGQLEDISRAEAARLQLVFAKHSRREMQNGEGPDPLEGQRLLALLHLLSGEPDLAISLAEKAPAVGWSGADHPGPVVIPFLLVAAIGGREPDPATALAEVWQEVNTTGLSFADLDADLGANHIGEEQASEWPAAPAKPRPVRLTTFLLTQITQRPPDGEQRERFLKAAWNLAQKRVEAILKGKHRRAYERAARLVAAVAEARILAGDAPKGHGILDDIRQRFARYYAFTGELNKIARRSPLLPSPPPKSRRW